MRPRDAIILETRLPGLPAVLATVLPGLISGPPRHPAYSVLGVQRMSLAGLADALAALHREPAWWRELYAALASAEPAELSELGALPVPLASGRLVAGPRGLLLPAPDLADPGRLALLGLRVVHPGAAHPLLTRLGAIEATPRSVLGSPEVRARVEVSYDDEDPGPVADAVLSLVAAAGCSRESCPGWPTWRCRAATASGTRPGNCCCPAARWPESWHPTRRSARRARSWRTATVPRRWRRRACWPRLPCWPPGTSRSTSPA